MSGVFITFEGTEGTGKSTQIALLAAALQARGLSLVVSREPGGTAFGGALRAILLDPASQGIAPAAELFLYLADRAQHVREVVAPALERGSWVLCDRFSDATIAYQGHGRGLDAAFIREASRRAAGGLVPDLTLLLESDDVALGLARARRRQRADGTAGVADRFEQEELAFHRRVLEGYRELARQEPGRIRRLPAALAPEEVHRRVLEEIGRRWHAAGAERGGAG